MAFGVHQKVSHDVSLAIGKGLQGLKVEAMANPGKPSNNNQRRGFSGRSLVESIMLGMFTIAVAAIPVIVTSVPAPESLLIIKENWCTPSICFGVLIVGVLIVTFWGGRSQPPCTPEQSHKKFADSYLTQGLVPATQIDFLRMPDIFFSADAARTHALIHPAAFPGQVAEPTSVMVPVYDPAFVPSQQPSPFSSHLEKDVEFLHRHDGRFESNNGERFVPRVGQRFVPRVDDRFSPRLDGRFSPRVEERFVLRMEDRVGLRVDGRFSPRVEERFVPKVDERYVPRVEERYQPQEQQDRFEAEEEDTYEKVDERYVPGVEERYQPQEQQDRFEAEEEDTYEPEEEVRYEAFVNTRARSDSEDEGRYAHVEDAESDREDEVEPEHEARYIKSEADDEGEVSEMHFNSEDEVEHYSHESLESHVQQPPLCSESVNSGKLTAPLHSPIAPPGVEETPVHTQLPPPQRQSCNASLTVAPDADAPLSLLSRRRPPTVPTPVIVHKAPPPPPPVSEPVATSPPEPEMSVRVERKEAPEMSPRIPPKHANERCPSSRSYAEFVRRTIDCPLPTSKVSSPTTRSKLEAAAVAPVGVLPKVGSSPKTEAVETSLEEKLAKVKGKRRSTAGICLMKQTSMLNKRPREVRVVDDDILDKELTHDPAEDNDVDQRVEAFLKNFREQMRLQRQESLQRHRRGDTNP